MARKHVHEEHVNHEAWAIPYGDLVTLLLAFFVVMYAISSVNESKYRVVADALSSAFGGPPRTISPLQLGKTQVRGSEFDRPSMQTAASKNGPSSANPIANLRVHQLLEMPTYREHAGAGGTGGTPGQRLQAIGRRIEAALSELVRKRLVTVRRTQTYLEVEIQSDILFASGVATPSPIATDTVRRIAEVMRDEPNAMRIEGYTDDRPIRTAQFPSNWELSAARAAGVVHVMAEAGIAPRRLAVVGYGEYQPIADNASDAGRNANRRVLLVIMAAGDGPDALDPPAAPASAPTAVAAGDAPAQRAVARGDGAPHALRTRTPSVARADDGDAAPIAASDPGAG